VEGLSDVCSVLVGKSERKRPAGRIDVDGKNTAIPVTGSGSPDDCESSRLPHFLDSRFIDGGDIANLRRLYPQEDS
jgi:hypothetical protein